VVYRGKPAVNGQGRFERFPVDGVTIWKAKNIHPDPKSDGIQISTKRLLWFKRLMVQGVLL